MTAVWGKKENGMITQKNWTHCSDGINPSNQVHSGPVSVEEFDVNSFIGHTRILRILIFESVTE
jgi:hypothetical protein